MKHQYPMVFEEATLLVWHYDDHIWSHKIPLKDLTKNLPKKKLYPLDAKELKELNAYIENFLESGWIIPSSSLYGIPISQRKKMGVYIYT